MPQAPDVFVSINLSTTRFAEAMKDVQLATVKFLVTCYLMFQKFGERDLAYYAGIALRKLGTE